MEKKLSPLNRVHIHDMIDFGAVTTVLGAVVMPSDAVCKLCPRDGVV